MLPDAKGATDNEVIRQAFQYPFYQIANFKTADDVTKLLDLIDVLKASNPYSMLKISGLFWNMGPRLCTLNESGSGLSLDTMLRISRDFMIMTKKPSFFLPEILKKAKKGDLRSADP